MRSRFSNTLPRCFGTDSAACVASAEVDSKDQRYVCCLPLTKRGGVEGRRLGEISASEEEQFRPALTLNMSPSSCWDLPQLGGCA